MKIEELFTLSANQKKSVIAVSVKDDCQVWVHPAYTKEFIGFVIADTTLDTEALTKQEFAQYYSDKLGTTMHKLAYSADDYVVTATF